MGPAARHSKANKELDWWKEKFALFWVPAPGAERVDSCPLADSPSLTVGKSSYRWWEGVTCRNSTVSSDSHLEVGHQQSDQRHRDGFRYSLSSVLGSVCSCFLRPILRVVAASLLATVWSSCS